MVQVTIFPCGYRLATTKGHRTIFICERNCKRLDCPVNARSAAGLHSKPEVRRSLDRDTLPGAIINGALYDGNREATEVQFGTYDPMSFRRPIGPSPKRKRPQS